MENTNAPSTEKMFRIDKDILEAAKRGDLARVKKLIENGADVNAKEYWVSFF